MPSIGVPVSAAPDQNRALNSSWIAIIGLRQKLSLAGLRGASDYIDQRVAPHIAPSKQGLLLAVADALAEYGVELHDIVGPGRGDLVSGTIAVLGRDRQLRELGPLPTNRSAALAGHEHHTFKDRGEVAGGAYNHKTMPDWRVKRHRSVMNRCADTVRPAETRRARQHHANCP